MSGYENATATLNLHHPPYNINLADFGTGYLTDVQKVVTPDVSATEQYPAPQLPPFAEEWRQKLRREEYLRKRICGFMVAHTPPEPLYTAWEDAPSYVKTARDINMNEELPSSEYTRYPSERSHIGKIALHYLGTKEDRLEPLTKVFSKDSLLTSLTNTLAHILLTGHALTLRNYKAERNRIVREWIPAATMRDMYCLFASAQSNDVNRNVLEAAKSVVAQLNWPEQRLPDFKYLHNDLQRQVIHTVGDEWLQLCDMATLHDPSLILSPKGNLAPLAKLSVADLRKALSDYPDLQPEAICHAFSSRPHIFQEELSDRMVKLERQRYSLQEPGTIASPDFDITKPAITKNQEVIHGLFARPEKKDDIIGLKVGQTVVMTGPQDPPITRDAFENLIEVNMELFARTLYETTMPFNLKGATLGQWTKSKVAAELCGETKKDRFNGKRRNLTITRTPVAAEDLQTYFGDSYDLARMDLSHAAQLTLTAQLQSSGRSPALAAIKVLIAIESHKDKGFDVIHRKIMQEGNTGRAITESYRRESTATANVLGAGLLRRGTVAMEKTNTDIWDKRS